MDDGAVYTVFDQAENLDNTLSACGFDSNLSVAFNRLVDLAHIASIKVSVTPEEGLDDLQDITDGNWPVRTIAYSRS